MVWELGKGVALDHKQTCPCHGREGKFCRGCMPATHATLPCSSCMPLIQTPVPYPRQQAETPKHLLNSCLAITSPCLYTPNPRQVAEAPNNLLYQLEVLGRWLVVLVLVVALVAFLLALLRAKQGFQVGRGRAGSALGGVGECWFARQPARRTDGENLVIRYCNTACKACHYGRQAAVKPDSPEGAYGCCRRIGTHCTICSVAPLLW